MSTHRDHRTLSLPRGFDRFDRIQLGRKPVVGRLSGTVWHSGVDHPWVAVPVGRFECLCVDAETNIALVGDGQLRVIQPETNESHIFELGEAVGAYGSVALASPTPGVFLVGAATGVGGAIWRVDVAKRDVLRRAVDTDLSAAEFSSYRNTNELLFSLSDGPGYTQEWRVGEDLSLAPCPSWFANVEVPRIAAISSSTYLYLGELNDILVMREGQVLKRIAMPEAVGGSFLVADLQTFVIVGDKFGRLWPFSKDDLSFCASPLGDSIGHPVEAQQVAAGPNNHVACEDGSGVLHIWGL